MGCCEATNPDLIGVVSEAEELKWDRRTALKGLIGVAGVIAVSVGPKAHAGATKLRLAFCGQLLCVVPYEVARARGHFAEQGERRPMLPKTQFIIADLAVVFLI